MPFFECLQCLHCGKLYDDDIRQPVTGSCPHTICVLCLSTLAEFECPVCEEKNAFVHYIVNIDILRKIRILNAAVRMIGGNVIVPTSCSKCKVSAEASLRVCVECITEFGVTMKAVEDRKWIVQSFDSHTGFTSCHFFCTDCVFANHSDHKTLLLANVQNLEDIMKMEALIHLQSNDQDVADGFAKAVIKSMKWENAFAILTASIKLDNEADHVLNDEDEPSTSQNVNVKPSNNFEETTNRVIRLKQKELKLHREYLQQYIQEAQENGLPTDKLLRIDKEFSEMIIVDDSVNGDSSAHLKTDVALKMEKLVESYRKDVLVEIDGHEDSALMINNFYKYRAIIKEFEDISQVFKVIDIKNLTEIDQNSTEMNHLEKALLELIEAHERLIYCNCMRLLFFPVLPSSDEEDVIYDKYIKDFQEQIGF